MTTHASASSEALLVRVPTTVVGVAAMYAAALSVLERRFPIKPDHIWAEVAGGVMISLVPLALEARKHHQIDWRIYEGAIWRCFIASGTPIILWQLFEALIRQRELLRYVASRALSGRESYAYDPATLAERSRERTRGSLTSSGSGSDGPATSADDS